MFWLAVLNDPRRRGVQDVLISCVDGPKGFPREHRGQDSRSRRRLTGFMTSEPSLTATVGGGPWPPGSR
jgi:hypothetical protein